MTQDAGTLKNLDDRTVLRVLSHLTEQMHDGLPDEDKASIHSEDEARRALCDLLAEGGINAPAIILPEGTGNATLARRFLEAMLEDPDTRPIVEALIDNPPDDEQRSVELAIAGAIILGGLITWLQTKLEIAVDRKDGKTEFHFRLRKNAAKDSLVRDTAKQVGKLLLI